MPKETFYNLPAEKREKIIDLALEEFALHDYRAASLSRIVEKAGIAKGSMYQYFENKKELYTYLAGVAAEKKFSFLSGAVDPGETVFLERYRQMVLHGARFDFSEPRYARLLYHLTYENKTPETADLARQLKKDTLEFIRQGAAQAVESSQIRSDIELDFIVFVIYQVTVGLGDYLALKLNLDMGEHVRKGTGLPFSEGELEKVVNDMITVFQSGLQA